MRGFVRECGREAGRGFVIAEVKLIVKSGLVKSICRLDTESPVGTVTQSVILSLS